jgi:hypothetical protein
MLEMWIEFMSAAHLQALGEVEAALEGFERAAERAEEAECVTWQSYALETMCNLDWRAGRPDPDAFRLDLIGWLRAQNRWWEHVELGVTEGAFVQWTSEGRWRAAGMLLGYLEANDAHHSLHRRFRAEAAAAVRAAPDGEVFIAEGAALSREQLSSFFLAELTASAQSTMT